jgi:hypothetical protein
VGGVHTEAPTNIEPLGGTGRVAMEKTRAAHAAGRAVAAAAIQ